MYVVIVCVYGLWCDDADGAAAAGCCVGEQVFRSRAAFGTCCETRRSGPTLNFNVRRQHHRHHSTPLAPPAPMSRTNIRAVCVYVCVCVA